VQARYSEEALKCVVFGVDLNDLMNREEYKNMIVPDVIFKCLCRIMEQHLEAVGIFRISGNQQKIKDYIVQTDTSM
jgi:superfamily I DNA and/or RNA helicase